MKILLILIIAGSIAVWAKPYSPALFTYKPPSSTTVAQMATPTPTPSDAEVIGEIVIQFAGEDRHTIKKLIDVAYKESGLRWNAYHKNNDGSEDFGVFQINSVHTKRFGPGFKTDYKENIKVAYSLYKRQGFVPWVAARTLGYGN